MPQPDAFMPLYGNDLLEAIKGYDDHVGMSYIHALWHYWHHTHCQGIPDDPDYLRRVCRQELVNWACVRPVVFGLFFKIEDGKWHQARCRELFSEINNTYQRRIIGAAIARDSKLDTNPDTKVDIKVDTKAVNNGVSTVGIKVQSESESESEPKALVLAADKPQPASKISMDEWLDLLSRSEAYQGIDVRAQYAKMGHWCKVNRKQPTQRRFINWLNRTDKPMPGGQRKAVYVPNI